MLEKNNFDELECFLAGTFHQDIENPSIALSDYIKESDSEWLNYISSEIECFLTSELTEYEKENFITECTFIYYPAIRVKPIEWLMSVLDEIRKSIIKNF